jgi:2-isopropylmalate synthase
LDSTLREGEQCPGVTFSTRHRLQIAWMLDYFGVDAIEISPVISADHENACRTMLKAGLEATIVAHVRALSADIEVARRCDAPWIAMYHSVSDLHLQHKLRVTREEALARILRAIECAKGYGLHLRFTMEDASRADPAFLKTVCRAVAKAGADRISLPDTVGVMLPHGMYKLVRAIRETVDTPLDVHCHNDLGLALANALAGIEAGASQIHTTINGIGERVGITPLAEAVMALRLLYRLNLDVRAEMLRELSDLVERYTGLRTPETKPLVGLNAYKHKAGTHLAAIIRNPAAYEAISPRVVGNRRRIVFGELSGKNGTAFLLRLLGLTPTAPDALRIAQTLKQLRVGDLFELNLSETMEAEAVAVEERLSRS